MIFFMKKIFNYILYHQKLAWFLAIFWTLAIFFGCSRPGKDLPKLNLFDNFDKVIHFVFFLGFAYFWHAIFASKNKSIWWAIGISVLYGFAIEVYQKYCVLGRSFDVWDIVADSVGAICILIIIKIQMKYKQPKHYSNIKLEKKK
jgi:VanZ family protein